MNFNEDNNNLENNSGSSVQGNYVFYVKIPKERVAVLIGTKGSVKKELMEETGVNIQINSETGVVKISGNDPIKVYKVRDIVNAIGRGFNPEKAKLLLRTDYMLEVINLRELVKSKNQIKRVKGRVIGEKGKSREFIENITDTYISVYGKTVSIIGSYENVGLARQALFKLINGSPHSKVNSWLEKKVKEMRVKEIVEPFEDEEKI